ncbi:Ig-like domain-containing protein [Shewanella sp. NIFS-20-20]|uniref:Ig-like domain-containing protein n=1 Tax=Shewanella sp. NIFS-20-20 TaxID=2853806 RepID=UPI001C46A68B|nr:Ig-like domain-containing protein [Shewanella sp. NIFS-20-20]MBV7315138.1 Ig-like domain-containing protein [Shewanella sp. NIFS-20-20]
MMSALRNFTALTLAVLLAACSGGGDLSSSGGDQEPEPSNSISVVIDNTTISQENPAQLTATVTDSNNNPLANELVTFTLNDNNLGTLVPAIGTAVTQADGTAVVSLYTASTAGAGKITASIGTGESADVAFTMVGDGGDVTGGAQIALALTDQSGNPISTINNLLPGRIKATVSGINKPVIVTFTSTKGELPIDTAVTNANGEAVVDIYAGNSLGAAAVVGTLSTGETAETIVVIGETALNMGSGTPFVDGRAAVSSPTLSAGGTASVSVVIQDANGVPYNQPIDVIFTSTCSSAITPKALLSSPVQAVNGVATSTYLAQGCQGDDIINVTANAGGLNLSATGTVNVLAADVGSIVFVSATPKNIGILGTGGDESSTIVFKVLDTNGIPVSNQSVNFSLNTDVGGIAVNPASATTNGQGLVQTVINSGTVATSVRVTAIVDGPTPLISSQSSELVVSTGIPDQDSFSLSASTLNAEGWVVDGTEVTVTARLADAYNNPVKDGTAVTFTTEGGAIDPSCTTLNGECSVVWRSQQARPDGNKLPELGLLPRTNNFMGQSYGGRATIIATAIGEESFPDSNGNGRLDVAEMPMFLNGLDVSGNRYDLDEAFIDHNEDGVFNPQQAGGESGGTNEELVDFDSDGVFDVADNLYNGVLCSIPAHSGCADGISNPQSINVRASLVLVMSGSAAYGSTPIVTDSGVDDGDGVLDIAGKSTGTVSIVISDLHNQQMPSGSIVSFRATAGSVVSTSDYTWPSSNFNGGSAFGVVVKGEDEPNAGSLIIEVTSPAGVVSPVATIPINIY